MKSGRITLAVALTFIVFSTYSVSAQRGFNGPGLCFQQNDVLSLTEQQKEKIKELRISFMKEIQPLQNEMKELKAHQRTLATASNPNISEINKNIDSQTALQNKMMKIRASHQQDVRKVLNDEQKLIFDQKAGKMRPKMRKGNPRPGMSQKSGNIPRMPGPFCPFIK